MDDIISNYLNILDTYTNNNNINIDYNNTSINNDTDNNLDDIYKLWIEDEDENDIIE